MAAEVAAFGANLEGIGLRAPYNVMKASGANLANIGILAGAAARLHVNGILSLHKRADQRASMGQAWTDGHGYWWLPSTSAEYAYVRAHNPVDWDYSTGMSYTWHHLDKDGNPVDSVFTKHWVGANTPFDQFMHGWGIGNATYTREDYGVDHNLASAAPPNAEEDALQDPLPGPPRGPPPQHPTNITAASASPTYVSAPETLMRAWPTSQPTPTIQIGGAPRFSGGSGGYNLPPDFLAALRNYGSSGGSRRPVVKRRGKRRRPASGYYKKPYANQAYRSYRRY